MVINGNRSTTARLFMEGGIEMTNSIEVLSLRLVRDNVVKYEFEASVTTPESVWKVAQAIGLDAKPEEEFHILCLDCKGKIVGVHMVGRGTTTSAIVHPREVFKRALLNNAQSIILMHNHPSGEVIPSKEDLDITRRLVEAGKVLGVEILDHTIVGDGVYLSFSEKGLI